MSENKYLSAVVLTPLADRIAAEKPSFLPGVQQLQTALPSEVYARCIEKIHNITQSGSTLLIVADSFMHRSLLEKECIPAIKKAFGVKIVRVTV